MDRGDRGKDTYIMMNPYTTPLKGDWAK
ncbi:Protein of unknown function [Bacillus wiedmannii]|uniref:Uncharacterized protein n=1 Tax=Bacillus wiedmannii TaxID=1890302 RepID=A0AB37YSE4_9BACI|nr:Protein of unknown function [Bacillus wiedmannii]SCN44171.1 Protein of unknown function [Bacillus wiedmannii]